MDRSLHFVPQNVKKHRFYTKRIQEKLDGHLSTEKNNQGLDFLTDISFILPQYQR